LNVKTILSRLAVALVLYAPPVFAADTNVIPYLTIAGETYTNVELGSVTGSRVTLFYDGGGQRFAISNLPIYLQQRLNYDPVLARSQDAAEAQRKAAFKERTDKEAQAVAIAQNTLGPAQKIRILKALPNAHVQIEMDGAPAEVYIHNLPPEILVLFREVQDAEANVTNLQAQLGPVQASSSQSAEHPHTGRKAARSQTSASQTNSSYHSNLQSALSSATAHLNALKSQLSARSLITARPSEFYFYPRIRQWEYQSATIADATPK
jgi:hypothetical protein